MYNGIGLTTPRGSGTNGYVQSNYSAVKNKKPNNNYQQKEKKDLSKIKSPNVDLLIHEEKKKVEIELYKLKSELKKQGKLTPEEIDQQISDQRKEKMKFIENKYNKEDSTPTEENNERNEKFKKALSLDREFEKKGIKTNEDAELLAFDSKLNETLKRKEKPSSIKKNHKKKRKHRDISDSSPSSDSSSSESASSSDSDE